MLFGSTLIRTLCALKSLLFDTVRTVFVLAMGCFYGEVGGVRPINLKRSIHTLLSFLPPSLPSFLLSSRLSLLCPSPCTLLSFSRSSPPQQSVLLCTLMTSWRERCTHALFICPCSPLCIFSLCSPLFTLHFSFPLPCSASLI